MDESRKSVEQTVLDLSGFTKSYVIKGKTYKFNPLTGEAIEVKRE